MHHRYTGTHASCGIKAAFHDTDNNTEEIARVGRKDAGVSGKSVSVSVSASRNAAFTQQT